MRRLAALLIAIVPLAGCLDGGPAPAPGADEPTPVATRHLDAGPQSGLEGPVRRVIVDQATWESVWAEHSRNVVGDAQDAPAVDFGEERVVAVVLSQKPNACWGVRVTNATAASDIVTLEVTTFQPPPDMFCAQVMTTPFHFVAIPADGGEVSYEEATSSEMPADEP